MADVLNLAVSKVGGGGGANDHIVYSVNLIHTGAATDDVFSQAINLNNLEILAISLKGLGASGRDVNIFLQGSIGLLNADFVNSPYPRLLALNGDLDDFSPDTGNITLVFNPSIYHVNTNASGVEAASSVIFTNAVPDPAVMGRYFRLRSDGQSGNPAASDTTALILCRKKDPNHGRTSYAAEDTGT